MSQHDALDLAQIDPPQWRVLVSGTVYGPYTTGQMQNFIRERRIVDETRVAQGDGGAFKSASDYDLLKANFGSATTATTEESEPSNYLIVAKLTGTGAMQMVSALNQLGKFAEVMPGVWTLRSRVRQARIRDRIQATVSSSDQVMIANTTSGRLAWLNLGPEADVHIRSVWDAKLD